jgi:hypothetical protein
VSQVSLFFMKCFLCYLLDEFTVTRMYDVEGYDRDVIKLPQWHCPGRSHEIHLLPQATIIPCYLQIQQSAVSSRCPVNCSLSESECLSGHFGEVKLSCICMEFDRQISNLPTPNLVYVPTELSRHSVTEH